MTRGRFEIVVRGATTGMAPRSFASATAHGHARAAREGRGRSDLPVRGRRGVPHRGTSSSSTCACRASTASHPARAGRWPGVLVTLVLTTFDDADAELGALRAGARPPAQRRDLALAGRRWSTLVDAIRTLAAVARSCSRGHGGAAASAGRAPDRLRAPRPARRAGAPRGRDPAAARRRIPQPRDRSPGAPDPGPGQGSCVERVVEPRRPPTAASTTCAEPCETSTMRTRPVRIEP